MSVPLDRLYNHIASLVKQDTIIYRWALHGSKNLKDLTPLVTENDIRRSSMLPTLYCHDQEPLDFYAYTINDFITYTQSLTSHNDLIKAQHISTQCVIGNPLLYQTVFTNPSLYVINCMNIYDYAMITHSELNSLHVDLYSRNGFVPVFFWSHGIIARDWFRYAEHDPELNNFSISSDFLIYNRAWQGSREYRLYFTEQLVKNNLLPYCQTSFNQVDQGVNYTDYQFENQKFNITMTDLGSYFATNAYTSTASADYCSSDYCSCGIEVVLETVFDGARIHLTEKTLRPIATGAPFLLAAGPGSLEFLHSYGFETFGDLIDESYDTLSDSYQRLNAIIGEMKRIASLPSQDKNRLWMELRQVAARNKKRFFSSEFQTQIFDEFLTNFKSAMQIMQANRNGKGWYAIYDFTKKYIPEHYNDVFPLLPDEGIDEHTWFVNQHAKLK